MKMARIPDPESEQPVVVLRCTGTTHALDAGNLRFLLDAAAVQLEDRMAGLRETPLDWENLDGVIGEFERKMDSVIHTNTLQQEAADLLTWVKGLSQLITEEDT